MKTRPNRRGSQHPSPAGSPFMENLLSGVRRIREQATKGKGISRQAPENDRQSKTEFGAEQQQAGTTGTTNRREK